MKNKALRILSFFICFFVLLCSCSENKKEEKAFFAMDTFMSVSLFGGKGQASEAEALIKEIERRYSINSADGEIALLASAGEIQKASEGLIEMLECAFYLNGLTDGGYDVTLLPVSKMWGFGTENGHRVPGEQELSDILTHTGMDKIKVTGEKVEAVCEIDLGSIAKGYAARECARMLSDKGVSGGVLNLGGNVVVFGEKPDKTLFKIGISDPANPENELGHIELKSGAVVTSGVYQRYFEENGKKYHHILDARTGAPCDNGLISVTVIHEDSMWADGLSTALFLLGAQGIEQYYRSTGGFEMIAVTEDGEVLITEGIEDSFYLQGSYKKTVIYK